MNPRFFIVYVLVISLALFLTVSVVGQSLPPQTLAGQVMLEHTASHPHAQRIELMGQFGGSVYAVAKAGDYAYLSVGRRLVVLDVSNPLTPMFVGQTDVLPGVIERLTVVGDYVYTASGRGGLRIIDVADPAEPTEVGFLDRFNSNANVMITDVVVRGHYAYIADSSGGLHIVNVADPTWPIEVGHTTELWGAERVAVAGEYAYVTRHGWLGGLYIVDISDPFAPHQVSFTALDFAVDVAVSDGYAYVSHIFRLYIFDISDPAHPVEVRSHSDWGKDASLTIAGGYLYAVDFQGILTIVNISEPTRPRYAGSYNMPGSSNDMAVDGGYAYVANEIAGLQIIDVADAAVPYNVAYISTPTGPGVGTVLAGNYAYYAISRGLHIIDITTPTSPTQTGWLTSTTYFCDIAVAGGYAYLAGEKGVLIVDVADAAAPAEVGVYHTEGIAYGVYVTGSLAYVADGSGSLHIVDIVDPTQPQLTGQYDFSGEATGVTVAGDYAYVTARPGRLRIINIADPAHPFEVGSIAIPASFGTRSPKIVGNYVYVIAVEAGLYIIDVADPAQPLVTGFYESRYVYNVDIAGDYAYVAAPYGYTMDIIDITDPANPTWMYTYRAQIWSVTVSGDFAYAGKSVVMEIIRIPNLKHPSPVGVFDTPFHPYMLDVTAGMAYIGSKDDGLHIFELSDPAQPTQVGFTTTLGSDIVVDGDYAYMVNGGRIIDISDPANLSHVATFEANSIALTNDYAYTGRRNRFDVWSVENPYSMTLMGYTGYDFRETINDVAANGAYGYAVTDYHLYVIDVTTPTQPSTVGAITLTNAIKVETQGDYAYVLTKSSLYVIDVTEPTQPTMVDQIYVTMGCTNMTISGHYAYLSCFYTFYLISLFDPARPIVVDSYPDLYRGAYNQTSDVSVVGDYVYIAGGGAGLFTLRFAPSVTGIIPPSGGDLISTIDNISYQFPTGAFTDTVIVTHTYRYPATCPTPGQNRTGIDHCFETTAIYSSTGQTANLAPGYTYTITIHYTDAEKGPAIENTLAFYHWDDIQWSTTGVTSTVDVDYNQITATTDHFSLWSVLGDTHRVFLPVVRKIRMLGPW